MLGFHHGLHNPVPGLQLSTSCDLLLGLYCCLCKLSPSPGSNYSHDWGDTWNPKKLGCWWCRSCWHLLVIRTQGLRTYFDLYDGKVGTVLPMGPVKCRDGNEFTLISAHAQLTLVPLVAHILCHTKKWCLTCHWWNSGSSGHQVWGLPYVV